MRELSASTSDASAANMSGTGTSDIRAATASPSKLGFAEGQDAGDGDGARDADFLRVDAGGAVPRSRSLGLGFEDMGASDVVSNSGEGTLPPPYANYLGGGWAADEA